MWESLITGADLVIAEVVTSLEHHGSSLLPTISPSRYSTRYLGLARKGRNISGGQLLHRICQTSYSYSAANDPRVHVGLGVASEVQEVVVQWPTGERERFGPLAVGRDHELVQGSGQRAPE